ESVTATFSPSASLTRKSLPPSVSVKLRIWWAPGRVRTVTPPVKRQSGEPMGASAWGTRVALLSYSAPASRSAETRVCALAEVTPKARRSATPRLLLAEIIGALAQLDGSLFEVGGDRAQALLGALEGLDVAGLIVRQA